MQDAQVTQTRTLLQKYHDLRSEADKFLDDAKADALRRATEAIADLNSLGFSNYRLDTGEAAKRRTRRVKTQSPKYVNPTDPTETWSGRGRMAAWLQELVDNGREKDEFLNPDRGS